MKSFIYRFYDKLFSEPLNSRLCWVGIAIAASYFAYMLIRIAL